MWPEAASSPADLSSLLRAPAGRDGFITVNGDGRLVHADGTRYRIWGVNVTQQAGLPPKEDAPIIAAHLARLGVNGVRFHFLDKLAPEGLIAADSDDTQRLDADQLDRLDFFAAELKRRGIYFHLGLLSRRVFKKGDGVREHETLGAVKSVSYFDPRIIELQKQHARLLLNHVNPYTGLRWADEPAVAFVELVNENALTQAWPRDRLRGTQIEPTTATWSDLPPSYAADLTARYNEWLARTFSAETLARLRADAGVAADAPLPRMDRATAEAASIERFRAELQFYMAVEADYFDDMQKFLRNELGVRVLVVGNSDHSHSVSGYPTVAGLVQLGNVEGHTYWQHPDYATAAAPPGQRRAFTIVNTAMVDDPLRSSVVKLARSPVAGLPYTVSEANHPFPAEHGAEFIPLIAAYAAFQDWDGIYWYTLSHDNVRRKPAATLNHFDLANDPVKMAQLAAGALLFLRGDVATARTTVTRGYSAEQTLDSLRLPRAEEPFFTPGFPADLPLRHAVRVSTFHGETTTEFPSAPPAGPIRSDTGELAWHYGAPRSGVVTLDAPRSQFLIGFLNARPDAATTSHLATRLVTPFASLTLGALDDAPIAHSSRLLLTAGARVANTGQLWNSARTSLEQWGGPPSLIEPVTGDLVLRGLANATTVSAQPLDGAGQPLGPPLAATAGRDGWTLRLGDVAAVSFVIEVTR